MTLCCLLAVSTILGCANIAKDEPGSASSSSTIEASTESSSAADEVTDSSDAASSKEESINSQKLLQKKQPFPPKQLQKKNLQMQKALFRFPT